MKVSRYVKEEEIEKKPRTDSRVWINATFTAVKGSTLPINAAQPQPHEPSLYLRL
jgi:hypothetical protein